MGLRRGDVGGEIAFVAFGLGDAAFQLGDFLFFHIALLEHGAEIVKVFLQGFGQVVTAVFLRLKTFNFRTKLSALFLQNADLAIARVFADDEGLLLDVHGFLGAGIVDGVDKGIWVPDVVFAVALGNQPGFPG